MAMMLTTMTESSENKWGKGGTRRTRTALVLTMKQMLVKQILKKRKAAQVATQKTAREKKRRTALVATQELELEMRLWRGRLSCLRGGRETPIACWGPLQR
jgi:hypothetical protein